MNALVIGPSARPAAASRSPARDRLAAAASSMAARRPRSMRPLRPGSAAASAASRFPVLAVTDRSLRCVRTGYRENCGSGPHWTTTASARGAAAAGIHGTSMSRKHSTSASAATAPRS